MWNRPTLETLGENDLFADDVKPITQQWLTKINELGKEVKNQKLRQVEWQKQTEELFKKVDLPELLKFVKFDALTKNVNFVDKGARSLRPKFPKVAGLLKTLVFLTGRDRRPCAWIRGDSASNRSVRRTFA